MKIRRKKLELENNSATPTKNKESQEILSVDNLVSKSGIVALPEPQQASQPSVEPEVEDAPEEDEDLSPHWEILIDKLPLMQTIATKFTAFDNNTCQIVCEFTSAPGVNSALFNWLQKPIERKMQMIVADHLMQEIERWEAIATPVALAAGEMELGNGEPWVTSCQLSLKSIKIT